MKFNTVAEAYAFYKNCSEKTMESRSRAIQAEISGNAEADIQAFNIELEGIENAMAEKRTEGKPAGYTTPEDRQKPPTFTAGNSGEGAGSKVYRSAFYKRLLGHELTEDERTAFEGVNAEKRAESFNTLGNSSAVVPETTLNEIITKARDMGGIMGLARAFNVRSNLSLPVATPGQPAQWHVEGEEVEREKVSPTRVRFAANEILKVLSISEAAQVMSIDAFESYLAEELSSSVMACLAQSMVDGDGDGKATGILSGIEWGDANQVTIAEKDWLDWKALLSGIATLHRGYSNGAGWVMSNKTLYGSVYTLHDDNNQPILLKDAADGGGYRLLGYPVTIDDFMDDDDILFGNFKFYGYNMPSGIAMDISRESGFTRGLVDYRALCICDAKPIVPEAFVRIKRGE